MRFGISGFTAVLVLAVCGSAGAVPYAAPPEATDLGPASAFAENAHVTVTVALKLQNTDDLERLIEATYTKGTPEYRQFLSTEQFQQRFAPSAATVAAVTQHFTAQGLTVTQSATAQLHVTGTTAQIEKAFAVQLHTYSVPATAGAPGYRFRAPLAAPQLPQAIAGAVHGVFGLDTRPSLRPHLRQSTLPHPQPGGGGGGGGSAPNTPDPPGFWTVVDFAQYYNVNPLYNQGLSGHHRTIGIITLASFTQSDAYAYWAALGLNVSSSRIKEIEVDGGSGPPSDASGSLETTLDVEQSGGLAPGAKMRVYEAPNTSQGFVDAFAKAIDDNKADTVSTSWGLWEFFDTLDPNGNGPVNNPVTGTPTSILDAYDDLLAQAALQGQSMFAAAGDSGAYDSTSALPIAGTPSFNPVLSVDDPGMQRYITSSGGTTLPGPQVFGLPGNTTITITVKQEQAWGWDYLIPLCNALGLDPISCGIYPAGTGGGVSVYVRRPFYQRDVRGMADSVSGQVLFELTPPPPLLIVRLPTDYRGRNVPDVSLNADPETGYIVAYTSSDPSVGFGFEPFWGGTSFVGPQLNGLTSLFDEALGQRVGLLNPALYQIATSGGYGGHHAPLRDITHGDNWYWRAERGYDQTTGVGVPDVANLLDALEDLCGP